VHWISTHEAERCIVRRDGAAIALVTAARSERLARWHTIANEADAGLFSVVAAPRMPDYRGASNSRIDYLGFGGAAQEETLPGIRPVAHCPGSPQGRAPEEDGPHGVTLVEAGADNQVRLRRIETDVVRFVAQTIHAGHERSLRDIEDDLHRRVEALRRVTSADLCVAHWTVSGDGPAVRDLLTGAGEELLRRLRDRYGHGPSSVWSAALDAAPVFDAAWRDHVAAARHSAADEYLIRLGAAVVEAGGAETLTPATDEARRLVGLPKGQRVAAAAARLGVELLAQGGAQS
jgi:hypothetical protein